MVSTSGAGRGRRACRRHLEGAESQTGGPPAMAMSSGRAKE